MKLEPGMKVLDIGCGVGGPMANLARYCGASFVGLNNNAYQIERGLKNIRDVQSLCSFLHCDFMQIPQADASYDAAIAIESIAHAPNKRLVFEEIWRILHPGALFAGYEWCLTENYDPHDAEHENIKKKIEIGNGLPDIASISEVNLALDKAGFELVEGHDVAESQDSEIPWFDALRGWDFSLSSIPRTAIGRVATHGVLRAGEALKIFPQGTHKVSMALNNGANSLISGGEIGIFTPMYYFLARKPETANI